MAVKSIKRFESVRLRSSASEREGSPNPDNTPADASATELTASQERARRWVVLLVFLIFWLVVLEGALRKWVFPGAAAALFFIRDPFVLLTYAIAFGNGLVRMSAPFGGLLLLFGLFLPWSLLQTQLADVPLLVVLFGLRMYFLYPPLAFVMASVLREADLKRFLNLFLTFTIPYTGLIFLQYASSKDAFINKAYNDEAVFVVAEGIVRTTGTYSFSSGQVIHVVITLALALAALMAPKRLCSLPRFLVAAVAVCAVLQVILSGSRTIFFLATFELLGMLFALMVMRGAKARMYGALVVLTMLTASVFLFTGPFARALNALQTRIEQAEAAEGTMWGRATAPFFLFANSLTSAPMTGMGIGIATGGGQRLLPPERRSYIAETELSRLILENGPVHGLLYLLARIALVIYMARGAVKLARNGNLFPVLLVAGLGHTLIQGQITMQGSINGLGCAGAGLILAYLSRSGETKSQVESRSIVRPRHR